MNPPTPATSAPAPASNGLTRRRKLLLAAEVAGIAAIVVFAWMRPTAEAESRARYRAFAEGVRAYFAPARTRDEHMKLAFDMPPAWDQLVASPTWSPIGPNPPDVYGVRAPEWCTARALPLFPPRPKAYRGPFIMDLFVRVSYTDDGTVAGVVLREIGFSRGTPTPAPTPQPPPPPRRRPTDRLNPPHSP